MSLVVPLLLLLAGSASPAGPPDWSAPLAPVVVLRAFDPPPADRPWLPGHRGVDLAAAAGAVVRSPAAGAVTFAGPLAGRGVVVVDHGGVRSTFEPVLPLVHRGERLAAGAVVGLVSAVPPHCGVRACLHWGVRAGGAYLDPLTMLLRGAAPVRVRLLPLVGGAVAGAHGPAAAARPPPPALGRSRAPAGSGPAGGGAGGAAGALAVGALATGALATGTLAVGRATATRWRRPMVGRRGLRSRDDPGR